MVRYFKRGMDASAKAAAIASLLLLNLAAARAGATALMRYLLSPAAAELIKIKGMDPG